MLKLLIAGALLSSLAFGETFIFKNGSSYNVHRSEADKKIDKKTERFKKTCEESKGVFDEFDKEGDNKLIMFYSCRMETGAIGYYFPEQTILLDAGDPKMFEKEVWGVK